MRQFIDVGVKNAVVSTAGKKTATILLMLLLTGVAVVSTQALKGLEEELKKYE